eukprot:TRINITY_DN31462_c0_g1_i1.p1 TRINITY_DN31462_c0_g1~~TRINITY_DN31462_c0_g1_i1.p1  ORF type:complete len:663 (-),score=126.25 TRINITY_DN31462_c0_g1_i1:76-2064(-)
MMSAAASADVDVEMAGADAEEVFSGEDERRTHSDSTLAPLPVPVHMGLSAKSIRQATVVGISLQQAPGDASDNKTPGTSKAARFAKRSMTNQSLMTSRSGRSMSEADLTEQRSVHYEEFEERAKMSPTACYRLMIASAMLRVIGDVWSSMAWLEYVRFYVLNDIAMLGVLTTFTDSPQYLAQAFIFPFLGVLADRVTRKKVLVAAAWAAVASNFLLVLWPSVEVLVATKVLNLVAEIGTPIREAMLRDLFCKADWEHMNGGSTGIKSRMGIPTSIAVAFAVAVGMGLMKLGDMGYGLPNEYSLHKAQCQGEMFCVPRGQYSWDGHGWHVEGVLRLLMVMGASAVLLDGLVILLFFPETVRADECPEEGDDGTTPGPLRRSLSRTLMKMPKELGGPWNNLRVFATEQLRSLMGIQVVGYIAAAGASSMFLSVYRRLQLDSFQLTVLAISAGPPGFIAMLAVPHIVDRFGDFRGLWVPSRLLGIFATLICCLVTTSSQLVLFIAWPLLSGPAGTFASFSMELLSKLIPPEVQGTYHTGKSFLYRLTQGVFMWPWLLLLQCSDSYPYPLDTLPVWVSLLLGVVSLCLTLRHVRNDPREIVWEGAALDEFWESDYAKGPWYIAHSGRVPRPAPSEAATSEAPSNFGVEETPADAEDGGCSDEIVNV